MKIITDQILIETTRCLVSEFDPEIIYLFGSYAWGMPNEHSDMDLMVIVNNTDEIEHNRMVRGLNALKNLDFPTDVLVKTKPEFDFFCQARGSLSYKIATEGRVLYERGG